MLDKLITATKDAMVRRTLDFARLATLVEGAKGINYGTIRIKENILEIEETLEEEGVFDTLMILRGYLITYAAWECGKDWWEVVDVIQQSTAVRTTSFTANEESKTEYYRLTDSTQRAYLTPVTDRVSDSRALWRDNDWLAVLWLLSFVEISYIQTLK